MDAREVVVIDKDDATLGKEPSEIEEIEEHGIESMVPVDEREIELAALLEEGRECDLGNLIKVLHERPHARFQEYLETAIGESCGLKWVQSKMSRVQAAGSNQAIADVQRGEPVGEANLYRSRGILSKNPFSKGFALAGADGNSANVVRRLVRVRDH